MLIFKSMKIPDLFSFRHYCKTNERLLFPFLYLDLTREEKASDSVLVPLKRRLKALLKSNMASQRSAKERHRYNTVMKTGFSTHKSFEQIAAWEAKKKAAVEKEAEEMREKSFNHYKILVPEYYRMATMTKLIRTRVTATRKDDRPT